MQFELLSGLLAAYVVLATELRVFAMSQLGKTASVSKDLKTYDRVQLSPSLSYVQDLS